MRTRTLLLAAFFGAGSIAMTAIPANAQTVRHHDTTHDVVKISTSDDGQGTVQRDRRQGDITWVRATYSKRSLFLSMRFRQLAKQHRKQLHYFSIRTSGGIEHEAIVDSGTKYPRGNASLTTASGGFLHCPLQHRVSYRHAVVTVTVPARCLGNPRWVRVGYGEAAEQWSPMSNKPIFADDGYYSGPLDADSAVVYGPEVHRG